MVDKEKKYKRQNEWQKQKTDRINFIMPKGFKEKIKEAAGKLGISSSEFIRDAITEKLRRNGIDTDSET